MSAPEFPSLPANIGANMVSGRLVPSSAPTERVSPTTARKAVQSLLQWRNSKSRPENAPTLEQEHFLYLVLTMKKIPPNRGSNPYTIALPHPLYSDFSELCLFIDSRPKSHLTIDRCQEKIGSENIPISKIVKFSELKSNYGSFESKRKLCDSYDVIFAEKSLMAVLPKLLGKDFSKKKKILLPVDLKKGNWKEQIEKLCGSALLYLSTGTCCVVKIAKASMSVEEIAENVIAVADGITETLRMKWGTVKSIHLKLVDSIALPIYQAAPHPRPKMEEPKGKGELMKRTKRMEKIIISDNENVGLSVTDASDDDDMDDDDAKLNGGNDGSAMEDLMGRKRKLGVFAELNGGKILKSSTTTLGKITQAKNKA